MKQTEQILEKTLDFNSNDSKSKFLIGVKKSLPIAMGYFPVSFTFGIMASNGGMDPLTALVISLTNFTSAGQFAGTNIILSNGTFLEVAVTTFIINIRYMLMSLSLSQKIVKMPLSKKLIMAFGITDETFTVASLEKEKVTFPYMMGLIITSYLAWALGTLTGAIFSTFLSTRLQNAMGIALYGMFLALIVPEARNSKKVLGVIVVSVSISLIFRYVPLISKISSGWVIIIATIIASAFGAIVFPRED
ncbi:AzlC family protein [Gottschalkia purinilytica]|uniref:AzlC family protein n=1 Tax=Gottschalkia purinilytica TaxID=1503 RepID=A0A0L0WAT6_GOTPU|nr:AzlC family ABC transporter permease [Gottschalkia purinilytica]KNF08611.1 AzlC family protein [Gottschalkia purinilytica]